MGCQHKDQLPILSNHIHGVDGTKYEVIPSFEFINQDSVAVNNLTFKGKAYVTDFFFTSCPTICPIMTQNMLAIYTHFEQDDELLLLSHSIDPKRDSIGRLKDYARQLGVKSEKWHFVTGDKDALYAIADDYRNVVVEDQNLPEGFDHSGRFTLVDPQGLIRSVCLGTDSLEVNRFIKDIEKLLNEIRTHN
jgi:protein SCO1/2